MTSIDDLLRRLDELARCSANDYAAEDSAAMIRVMRSAMDEFCDRVERGEIRSKRTYQKFCTILGRNLR